jgi:hypothetical protein
MMEANTGIPNTARLLGINLTQLEQLLLQLCRIQVLLLGELVQDKLELHCLSFLHEHVGVTDDGASVQQPSHHTLKNVQYRQNSKPADSGRYETCLPRSLGINLAQLEQLLLQLCRIQVLLLGQRCRMSFSFIAWRFFMNM